MNSIGAETVQQKQQSPLKSKTTKLKSSGLNSTNLEACKFQTTEKPLISDHFNSSDLTVSISSNQTLIYNKNHHHESIEFTELFNDFPECYDSIAIIGNYNTMASQSSELPSPVYQNPPTPPPISQMPSMQRNKKFLQDKISTLSSTPKQKSPYKGRVTEFKNCISRGLFPLSSSSLSSSSSSTSTSAAATTSSAAIKFTSNDEYTNLTNKEKNKFKSSTPFSSNQQYHHHQPFNSNDNILYDQFLTSRKISPDDILTKPEFTSSLMKNVPVRPRKGGIPHLDNYCLFDPRVDFINEKDNNKKRNSIKENGQHQIENCDQCLMECNNCEIDFSEELIDEIIYSDTDQGYIHQFKDQIINTNHHNYFTIGLSNFEDVNDIREYEQNSENIMKIGKRPQGSLEITQPSNIDCLCSSSEFNLTSKSISLEDIGQKNKKLQLDLKRCVDDSFDLEKQKNYCRKPNSFGISGTNRVNKNSAKYKLIKSRPLSTNSDADSGFLSPNSPDELKLNPTLLIFEKCDNIIGYIEIYTDWANYYLERAKSKRKVTDLSADCRDGLLLADIIEAVTSFKVPDIVKKPKTQQQMFDNVNSSLILLRSQSVGGLETITANDICSGHLKAVLALFFALSKYKQQSKQQKAKEINTLTKSETSNSPQSKNQQQQTTTNVTVHHNGNVETMMTNRQIPVPYSKTNGVTAIPLPATVLVQRRCPPDKVRPLPPTPNHVQSNTDTGKTNQTCEVNGITNLGSPTKNNIQLNNQQSPQKGNNNGLRQPQCKIVSSPYAIHPNSEQTNGIIPQSTSPQQTQITNVPTTNNHTKHSMLDKLKLFNKDKSFSSASTKSSQVSKRTSSSSGFSSARSERSDSSLSLNDCNVSQIRPPSQIFSTNTITRSKDQNAKNATTKQTKLFSSGTAKGTQTGFSVKNENRKDKSPARTKEDPHQIIIDPKVQIKCQKTLVNSRAAATILEQQKTKSSSKLSLSSSKSGSKTSLVIPPISKTVQTNSVSSTSATSTINNGTGTGTGIPKPMAAVKGTSKNITIEKPQQYQPPQHHQQQQQQDVNDVKKLEKNIISNNREIISYVNTNSNKLIRDSQRNQHIINPIGDNNSTISNASGICGSINMNKLIQQNIHNISMSDSLHSSSTHSGLYSNSSESSVIYQPSSESGGSNLVPEQHYANNSINRNSTQIKNPIPNRKDEFLDTMIIDNNFHQNNHQNEQKFHTVPTKSFNTIYEEEKSSVNVMPMRPLLRGYNSHVTLPKSSNHNVHNSQKYFADFCESDIGQGYCSDGDVLRYMRPTSASSRFVDIDNGYLSEGSAGGAASNNGKHFLSVMKGRPLLPTTIEERIRGSRGSLNSIGTAPPSIESQSIPKIMHNGGGNDRISSRSSSRNGIIGVGIINDNASLDGGKNVNGYLNLQPSQNIPNRQSQTNLSTSRKEKSSPNLNRRNISSTTPKQSSSTGRTKGVPQSFGYVKRSNGSATGTITSIDQQIQLRMLGQQQQQQQQQQLQHHQQGRTALISAVPRSVKNKISGGTQTCQDEMQAKIPLNNQHRSFSLTGQGATQLSQSVRERLLTGSHSLPKPGTDMHIFQHRITNRGTGKVLDGSLSDTQTYAEVKPEYSTYAMWLKHSSTTASRLSEGDSLENIQSGSPSLQRERHGHKIIHRGGETTFIQSSRMNRSNSIRSTKSEKLYPSMLNHGQDVEIEPYYCLPVGTATQHNSNNKNNTGPNLNSVPWSQPTSPTPPHNRGFGGPMSPTHAGVISTNISSCHRLTYPKKNDEVHGSAASLLSGGSSLYGSVEERQANEVRRLKRELTDARDQVMSLSSQLSTNAHVVAAFEQSLSHMTTRLHHLTATAERKDGELTDMRQTIELLRKQSIQAGLTTAHMQSMGVQQSNVQSYQKSSTNPNENVANVDNNKKNLQQIMKPVLKTNGTETTLQNSSTNGQNSNEKTNINSLQRHHSTDSMCSLNSISSGCSAQDKKKKKGWLRSSFTKAFSRNAKVAKTNRIVTNSHSSNLDQNSSLNSILCKPGLNDVVKNSSLPPPSPTKNNTQTHKSVTIVENAKPVDIIEPEGQHVVEDLKKQLREKDLVLTDIRLEALSSASQLENLRDTVMKMRAEMLTLKQNNERLQKLVISRSLAGSEVSLGNASSPNGSIGDSRRYSLADGNNRPPMELPSSLAEDVEEENIPPAPAPEPPPIPLSPTTHIDLTPPPPAIEVHSPTHLSASVPDDIPDPTDGKKISISVYLGQPESFAKYLEEINEFDNFYANENEKLSDNAGALEENLTKENTFEKRKFLNPSLNEIVIAYTYISGKTSWQNLDYIVRKTFKDYVARIDPGTNLGLNTDSITSYHLGEAKRGPEMGFPELLPCGYIIGNVKNLYICLQGVGSFAFDSLIPRSIVHRYISLLTEHRRLILCGPSGTGKSYLATKLAEFLVARSGRGNPSEAIATFNVDHKSSKELRQYLSHIAEQASMSNAASELPSVIILDNLHHASALGDVFSCLLSAGPVAKLPCIIGTMSQATCNTTNLQLHHNFRWVLTANHMEPVKGFLGRFLRRRVFSLELQTQNLQPELTSVLAWLSTVWQHINRFLEKHSSSDITIGPRLFLSCPLHLKDSQVWFTDVWNYHLAPYLIEAVREGVQLYGRRGGAWNDPSTFIRDTYPWPYGPDSVPPLRQIKAEDVGLEDGDTGNSDSQDPLLNMLMRLQEAANYSGNQEQESDCASLDSNITADSSAGPE